MSGIKRQIEASIKKFHKEDTVNSSLNLFKSLNYETDLRANYSYNTAREFIDEFCQEYNNVNEDNLLSDEWGKFSLLFQLDKTTLFEQISIELNKKNFLEKYESYIFSVLELKGANYTKSELSKLTREINKPFMMPVMILFKYSDKLTFSIIDRRINKKDEQKDVLKKVTLIKDISILNPHRAHIDILSKLEFDRLIEKNNIRSFPDFHKAFKGALSISELNNNFYRELSNWYFWAKKTVVFPDGKENLPAEDNSVSVIRLITRMIFIWFMKEKKLIPEKIFDEEHIKTLLNDELYNESTYYKVILQNLFFATLNQEMNKRGFREEKRYQGKNIDYNNTGLYRYKKYFKNPKKLEEIFKDIPFLNGGLFKCLDDVDRENSKKIYRYDGFSDRKENIIEVPGELFFSDYMEIDLSKEYGSNKYKKEKVKGLINLFNHYIFTVDENTPLEEEIALDPELLGRVFENLLASYNPETKSSARKSTGSYYTPREVVQYMVDESLIYYLSNHLDKNDNERKIKTLVGYNEFGNPFNNEETDILIEAIYNVKILDPACGSGAFPMGALNKLVYILHKLDPNNKKWKNKILEKTDEIDDPVVRENQRGIIIDNFENNELDYGRKLYLIEKCIYGADIQPIAIQISKLRFFISLLVDQNIDKTKANLGVKSLPNLETKFICTNTLINLKEDNVSISDIIIENKRKELFDLRHKYFFEKNKYRKSNIEDRDKKLRKEIADILIKNGWQADSVYKLVNWDPYDSNKSASFFDTEWMFGLKDGFDVVIGNPPYGNILKKSEKNIIRKTYNSSTTKEIYSPFIEKSIISLKKKGYMSFIISYSITFSTYLSVTRALLKNNFGKNILYTFDRDKCRIFSDSMTQSVTILKSYNKNNKVKGKFYTSEFFRESPNLSDIKVSYANDFILPKNLINLKEKHRLPKIGNNMNYTILKKLYNSSKHYIGMYLHNKSGNKIVIRSSGNYWYNAFYVLPYKSTEMKIKYVKNDVIRDFLIILLNSSTFYFWMRIYGDGRHLNFDILNNLPLPNVDLKNYKGYIACLSTGITKSLIKIFDSKLKKFNTRLIKKEIDKLDYFLAKIYNLTEEEYNYIINYDDIIRNSNDNQQTRK